MKYFENKKRFVHLFPLASILLVFSERFLCKPPHVRVQCVPFPGWALRGRAGIPGPGPAALQTVLSTPAAPSATLGLEFSMSSLKGDFSHTWLSRYNSLSIYCIVWVKFNIL